MEECKNTDWFENWFDSPYYHILYKHRNHQEAELFIDNLINDLNPPSASSFLDLACGKGRHSIYLCKKGFDVTGIDLSPENIAFANECIKKCPLESHKPEFYIKDMRKLNWYNQFDYIINLFTSFGYFESEKDEIATIQAVSEALKPEGIFVLDFMNVRKILSQLVLHEVKIIDEIEFEIHKSVENGFIVKKISFTDKGKKYHFQERVKALLFDDFKKYFEASNLEITDVKGSYKLEPFDEQNSWRLILIARKKSSSPQS